ncbi:hypothetical protein [Candidatus Uabimicrobium sp. HlEnr_7]|uniref:hypothetical protein n=1 Tax=Candidatus Uabimicrobium helgolandensis TaxID=3095367 RepID=UPI00355644C4
MALVAIGRKELGFSLESGIVRGGMIFVSITGVSIAVNMKNKKREPKRIDI